MEPPENFRVLWSLVGHVQLGIVVDPHPQLNLDEIEVAEEVNRN